jgi:hypothetical protein
MRALLAAFVVTSCAAAPKPELSGNEKYLRAFPAHRWNMICRDLRASLGEGVFLRFVVLDGDHIAGLKFVFGPGPRYDEVAIPPDLYGPFHGEEVTERGSPWLGARDYKITDQFHLFLPLLRENFENDSVARDRDLSLQNAVAEAATNGQRYASILHLRCVRE